MKISSILFAAFVATTITGCETDYTCGQFPSSGCQPISQVYENTKGELYDYRIDMYKESMEKRKSEFKPTKHNINDTKAIKPLIPDIKDKSSKNDVRVYFTDWVDEEQDYNGGSYSFIKIRDK